MKKEQREIVNWAKAELYEYYRSERAYKLLCKRLEEIEVMVSVHSPKTDGVRGTGTDRDSMLADYVTRRARIAEDIESMDAQRRRAERLLSCIDDDLTRGAVERIYSGRKRIETEAMKRHYTVSGFKSFIDSALLRAVKKYIG